MEIKQTLFEGPDREEMLARGSLGGHPFHAILTDFPIACFTLAFVWNLVVILVNDQPWYAMTFWTMLAGLIMVVPTAVVGLMGYAKVLRNRHPGAQIATIHMVVNTVGTMVFFLSLVLRGGPGPLPMGLRALTFLLTMFGFSVLMLGAFLGGQVVERHGIGVGSDGDRPATSH